MLKTQMAVLFGISLFSLSSCQENNDDFSVENVDVSEVSVNFLDFNTSAGSSSTVDLQLFQFSDGMLQKKIDLTLPTSDPVCLVRGGQSKVYAVSGVKINEAQSATDEEAFALSTVTSPQGAQSAPVFFAGIADHDGASYTLDIAMERGVARFDIENLDPEFAITKVDLIDAPAASYIFGGQETAADFGTVNYSRLFDEGIYGLEKGVFTLFESAHPVTLNITGTAAGNTFSFSATAPSISRNKVYTVSLTSVVTTAQPIISVSDWEAADNIGFGPDHSHAIELDLAASVLPAGVSYDAATRTLDIPASGAPGLKLAFASDLRVDIDTLIFNGARVEKDSLPTWAFLKSGAQISERGNEIITTHPFTVEPQRKGRPAYEVRLGIRKASISSIRDYITVRVAAHPQQIETVKIGGHEWMAYNATSSSLDDQIYTTEGLTVAEMYDQHFVDCLGMGFQYGKPNPFDPFASNDPNLFADMARNIPWTTPGMMPLPEGYHVASFKEWTDLMPNGVILPSAWMTASGDSIKGYVVTLPGTLVTHNANVNSRNFKMRYVVFESVTTGARLVVPFGGLKSNSTTDIPIQGGFRFETRTAYWVSDDRYTMLIDYKATEDGGDGAKIQRDRWNYDGFLMVRGIKD